MAFVVNRLLNLNELYELDQKYHRHWDFKLPSYHICSIWLESVEGFSECLYNSNIRTTMYRLLLIQRIPIACSNFMIQNSYLQL